MRGTKLVVSLIALFLIASPAALAASGDKAKVKGMITSRTAETSIVRFRGETVTIVLTDDTKTQDKKGLFGLEKDIDENTQRFMTWSEYDAKGAASVKVAVGSSNISPPDQEQLKQLAEAAAGLKGYIIEVMGYADSTGRAARNTKLSEDRAKAVVTHLVQQGNVPVRHMVAPGAMGEYGCCGLERN